MNVDAVQFPCADFDAYEIPLGGPSLTFLLVNNDLLANARSNRSVEIKSLSARLLVLKDLCVRFMVQFRAKILYVIRSYPETGSV